MFYLFKSFTNKKTKTSFENLTGLKIFFMYILRNLRSEFVLFVSMLTLFAYIKQ